MNLRSLVTIAITAVGATAARADIVDIAASKDNTLIEKNDGSLSNGAGKFFFAGNTGQGNEDNTRRAVIAFDIGAAIPPGSTINSVTLQPVMSRGDDNGNRTIGLHVVSQDWGEGASNASGGEGAGDSAESGDATWLYTFYDEDDPPSSPAWASAGGDFAGSPSDTELIGNEGFYTWGSTAAMVQDVQGWLDNPATNYGWLLLGDESTSETAKRFNTRENTDQQERPKLTVDFTPGGTTGACCLEDGSCVVVTAEAECTGQDGAFQGLGSDCMSADCPQPAGACCLSGGVCDELTEVDCLSQSGLYQGDFTSCTPNPCPLFLEPFVDPMPIPPLADPVSGSPGGVATYDMAISETQQQLHSDLPLTTVWGYDDGTGTRYPGPTILATADQAVTVNWINDLRYATGAQQGELRQEHYLTVDLCPHGPNNPDFGNKAVTVTHLHGGHVPPRFDGYPEHRYEPGLFEEYVYDNNQLGATLWYHDHALGVTRLNVMMGLAGGYVLRDQNEIDLVNGDQLPGLEFDVPLIIQDRTFDDQGQIVYPAVWQDHFFGEVAVVNGKVWPFLQVVRGKYRFRLLGGSNSREYALGLSNGDMFTVIGTDGGPLETPVDVPTVEIGPGERVEVIVDFQPYPNGTEIILTNSNVPSVPGAPLIPEIMKFVVQGGGGFTNTIPDTLRVNEVLMEDDAVISRDFVLRKDPDSTPDCGNTWWLINGLGWDDITEFPELGTTEVWRFANDSGQMHPMHMHLVFFQVLDHTPIVVEPDGTITEIGPAVEPSPTERGWKDTVRVQPHTATRVIARFEDYAGKFAYHCHILEHEDHEMMRQFQAKIPCAEDTDRNGTVDVADLVELILDWGACPEPCSELGEVNDPDTCPTDINRDCSVDVVDLTALILAWGPC
jgi:spore coat protein A